MHLVLIASILMLCCCAKHYMGATYSDPYGFFSGVLHGFVFPFALISKIISWGSSIFDINIFTDIEFVGRPNTGLFFTTSAIFLVYQHGSVVPQSNRWSLQSVLIAQNIFRQLFVTLQLSPQTLPETLLQ